MGALCVLDLPLRAWIGGWRKRGLEDGDEGKLVYTVWNPVDPSMHSNLDPGRSSPVDNPGADGMDVDSPLEEAAGTPTHNTDDIIVIDLSGGSAMDDGALPWKQLTGFYCMNTGGGELVASDPRGRSGEGW